MRLGLWNVEVRVEGLGSEFRGVRLWGCKAEV